MKWIDVNLPWKSNDEEYPEYKSRPDFSDKIREVFGHEYGDLDALLSGFPNEHRSTYRDDKDDIMQANPDFTPEELKTALRALNNSSVNYVLRWHELSEQVSAWEDTQPELHEVYAHNEKVDKERTERRAKVNFQDNQLCRGGVLIEVRNSSGRITQMVIGDINALGGSCNDCMGINNDDLITRCCVLWTKEEKES